MFRPHYFGHLHGARKFFDVCSFCVKLCVRYSTRGIEIVMEIKILRLLKSVYS